MLLSLLESVSRRELTMEPIRPPEVEEADAEDEVCEEEAATVVLAAALVAGAAEVTSVVVGAAAAATEATTEDAAAAGAEVHCWFWLQV